MLDDKILNFFKSRGDGYVSGEELSEEFGISRTAIWKHMEKFRDQGYEIAASPHLGYRLVCAPDRLTEVELKWQLNTDIIGKKIYSYNEISSTNDIAHKIAVSGEGEGALVLAEYQTEGRGRLGRKWLSPRSKGVYLSVILRPNILPREISIITLFSSLVVAKTIRKEVGLSALIKWPNDVMINNKKVCGILTELNGEADRVNFVIAGIGINVNTKKELLPEGASSLCEEKGKDIDRIGFTKSLLVNLDKYYKAFLAGEMGLILNEYKSLSAVLDRNIKINYHNRSIAGHAVDVDKDGALVVRLDNGFHERVLAGAVTMLR